MGESMSTEIIAEIAARYRAAVPPGLTIKVIPRGVSGLPELGQGEHWRVAMKRQADRAKAVKALVKRLAEADRAAIAVEDEAADRAQLFADIAADAIGGARNGVKAKKRTEVAVRAKRVLQPALRSEEAKAKALAAMRAVAAAKAETIAARIHAMIATGANTGEIGKALGMTHSGARKFMARHGIERPERFVVDGITFADGREADGYRRKQAAKQRADAIAARLADGATLEAVAAEFGTTKNRVHAILSLHGATPRRKTLVEDDAMSDAVRKAFRDGLSLPKTAALLGVGATTVYRIQQRLGLKPEPKRVEVAMAKRARSTARVVNSAIAEECARLFREGLSDARIGLKLGISRSSAQRARQSIGVYGATPHETELHRAIRAQYDAGFSMRAIAVSLGVSKATVCRVVNRAEAVEVAA